MKQKKKMPNTVRILDDELMKWIREYSDKTGITIYRIVQEALQAFKVAKG